MSILVKEYRPKQHWGNSLWSFMHSLLLDNIDNIENIQILKNLLINIQNCMPCYKCKNKYIPYLSKLENINSVNELFNWSIDLHNEINKYFSKSEWTYDMAKEEWKNSSSSYYLWKFIHTSTIIDFEFNQRYNEEMKNVLLNISSCILNQKDKEIFIKNLALLNDLDMSKPMVLFYWSIDVHNEVNMKNSKPVWTYDIALEKWANVSCLREINNIQNNQNIQTGPTGTFVYSQNINTLSYSGPSGPCCNDAYLSTPIISSN